MTLNRTKMNNAEYKYLIAKADKINNGKLLPLWMHLRDAAGVMEKLVAEWIPEAVFEASGLERDDFKRLAIFCAATHDIGKATSYFQSIITRQLTGVIPTSSKYKCLDFTCPRASGGDRKDAALRISIHAR